MENSVLEMEQTARLEMPTRPRYKRGETMRLFKEMRNQGKTNAEIQKELGICRSYMSQLATILIAKGEIKAREPGNTTKESIAKHNKVYALYKAGVSRDKIASRLKINKNTVNVIIWKKKQMES